MSTFENVEKSKQYRNVSTFQNFGGANSTENVAQPRQNVDFESFTAILFSVSSSILILYTLCSQGWS